MDVKKLSGRRVLLLLLCSAVVTGGLVFASITPAETSSKCTSEYMKERRQDECLTTTKSNGASTEAIDRDN